MSKKTTHSLINTLEAIDRAHNSLRNHIIEEHTMKKMPKQIEKLYDACNEILDNPFGGITAEDFLKPIREPEVSEEVEEQPDGPILLPENPTDEEACNYLTQKGWHLTNRILFAPSGGDRNKDGKYICSPDEAEALDMYLPGGCWKYMIRHGLNWVGGPW